MLRRYIPPSPSNLDHVSKVEFFDHMSYSIKAFEILCEIAVKVRPIMIAYGWKVGSLEEMTTENLYGLNFDHGKRILLRLRSNYDQTQFLPFGMIMDTMLHELAHNAHNGHGDSFYRTWDKLREEYYSLSAPKILGKDKVNEDSRGTLGISFLALLSTQRHQGLRSIEMTGGPQIQTQKWQQQGQAPEYGPARSNSLHPAPTDIQYVLYPKPSHGIIRQLPPPQRQQQQQQQQYLGQNLAQNQVRHARQQSPPHPWHVSCINCNFEQHPAWEFLCDSKTRLLAFNLLRDAPYTWTPKGYYFRVHEETIFLCHQLARWIMG